MQMRLGESLRFTLFGTSHGPKVGAFLEGVPKGIKINRDLIQKAMDERKPGGNTQVSVKSETMLRYYPA